MLSFSVVAAGEARKEVKLRKVGTGSMVQESREHFSPRQGEVGMRFSGPDISRGTLHREDWRGWER